MKYYGKNSLSQILVLILNIILVVGLIMTIYVYYDTFFLCKENLKGQNKGILFLLLTSGIACVFFIVFHLKKIIITLINEKPFVFENVKSLRNISLECFIISLCYLGNFIVNFGREKYRFIYLDNKGIHTDMEPIIFVLASVFIFILSNIFNKAVEYKEENDFTI